MKVAIHQPHYFPWEGYISKMKDVDKFILMDEVQLTDSSPMYRHALLTLKGEKKYITIPFEKNDYKHKSYKNILINTQIDWQKNHINFLKENYSKSPFYGEIMDLISCIFTKKYKYICDVTVDTILLMRKIFNISTDIVLQSDLNYPNDSKKNQLVLDLCIASNADYYLSGQGAKKYMELEPFDKSNVIVEFQSFKQTEYSQHCSREFIAGLSILDMLLSVGIKKTKECFI
jgi:predicted nucleic acid-binding protein